MYNWITDLEKIYDILEVNELVHLKNLLYESQLSGGTGWEIFLLITKQLIEIKETNPTAYLLINNESERILHFGYKNGFLS